jgi:serine/threonine protein kinase
LHLLGQPKPLSRYQFKFPQQPALSAELKDLITKMLRLAPADRLAIAAVKAHPWCAAGLSAENTVYEAPPEVPIMWPVGAPPPLEYLVSADSVDSDFWDGHADDDDFGI